MNAKFLFNDAQAVKAQINAFIAQYPEIAEDTVLLADMLEGETDLHSMLQKALTCRLEAEGMVTSIKQRETDLTERRKRYERQSASIKTIIQTLMECAGQDKVTLPEATLSITKARESVNVINVNDLPQGYFAIERKADKKAIMDALKAGEQIPGAEIALGDCGLTIRTK